MDFEAAVNAAFEGKGQGVSAPSPPPPPPSQPQEGIPVEPFEHDFHGLPPPPPQGPPPPQEGRPKKYKKRVRLHGVEPPIKKQRPKHDPSTLEERKELHEKIMRYVDSFPEHIFPEAMGVSPETPFDELTYVLQRIQQRINAKQELQVLQSGLVTTCMAAEFASSMLPKNPIKLQGFGQNVASNIEMFNDSLKQLACKYGGSMQISVEAQIGMMLVRLAANTHLSNLQMEKVQQQQPPPPLEQEGFVEPPPQPPPFSNPGAEEVAPPPPVVKEERGDHAMDPGCVGAEGPTEPSHAI